MNPNIHDMAVRLLEAAENRQRFIVALAGPPGAGKSFLSEWLCRELNERQAGIAAVVPMDGYHLDNAILEPLGQLPIKGAPETFDPDGLRHDLERIRRADRSVAVPVFDRPLDLARAGGRLITLEHRIVIVEGNYLLLDRDPWRELHPLFDMTLLLEVADEVLEARLIQRWLGMGQEQQGAVDKARNKDMLNARLIKRESIAPDLYWR
ncbi:nucleoside triphosphate hydrolase [Halomonas sp. MCCC 1A17488]|uniref:Nucleoside triphosphate hydrolase n=1 Tax=Billgrantia sulfidoxydans TaxID=2733484 RepID=A0ABX7W5V6_9GAMM|nr:MULTISPECIES: nucleoside triphosphate hydrolase [Halomonas]MCE8015965.1 nucleoside triphosphate hydrolase [Halomonas sp. MCCC 1A17488]MCG3239298.1 nucleoside triphosphate hydrolase [Halomonas sp. MCCC 1A17488]QPP50769.1 nucleoside triphosphate hydrolase [Halomonas sp. SS10-MC5]QTP54344.1 nucleoside triphosphate hydrolase [Halomonas sulfidoxydans]